jgi:hypothetical protein
LSPVDRKTPAESGEKIDVLFLSPMYRKGPVEHGKKINVLLLSVIDLRNEIHFFFLVLLMELSIRGKMTGKCIITQSARCKVSVIFAPVDTPSTTTKKEFLPYHLIT